MRICKLDAKYPGVVQYLWGQFPIFAIAVLTSRTACWGPRWAHNRSRVAKAWFESTSQLYHGKLNYDRRWKLLFRNCIVLFCQSRDVIQRCKSNKIKKRLVDASISVLCWRSSTVERHHSLRFDVKIAVQVCSLAFKANLLLNLYERRNTYSLVFLP